MYYRFLGLKNTLPILFIFKSSLSGMKECRYGIFADARTFNKKQTEKAKKRKTVHEKMENQNNHDNSTTAVTMKDVRH